MYADPALHKISPTKRQCYLQVRVKQILPHDKEYLQDEKSLKYYEHYTLLNCMMECEANVTWNHCGCNMYYQVEFRLIFKLCCLYALPFDLHIQSLRPKKMTNIFLSWLSYTNKRGNARVRMEAS